jgi:hypothetical protein
MTVFNGLAKLTLADPARAQICGKWNIAASNRRYIQLKIKALGEYL